MKREAGQSLKDYFCCWSRQMTGHLLARSAVRLLPWKRQFFLIHGGCWVSVNEIVGSALHVMFNEHSRQVIESQEHPLNTYLLISYPRILTLQESVQSLLSSQKKSINKYENHKHTVPCVYANILQNIPTTAGINPAPQASANYKLFLNPTKKV